MKFFFSLLVLLQSGNTYTAAICGVLAGTAPCLRYVAGWFSVVSQHSHVFICVFILSLRHLVLWFNLVEMLFIGVQMSFFSSTFFWCAKGVYCSRLCIIKHGLNETFVVCYWCWGC